MKATEDFLETTPYAHIVAAAKQVIKTTGEVSDCNMLAKGVVEQFVKVSLPCFHDDDDEPLPCEARLVPILCMHMQRIF